MIKLPSYKQLIRHIQSPRVEQLIKQAAESNAISLAGGLPSEELFPTEAMQETFEKVITEHAEIALQYSWGDGYEPLREQICQYMLNRGITVKSSEILITHGIQQGLDLLTRLFVNTNDPLLLESPTYVAAINAFELQKARFLTINRNEQGIDTEELRSILKKEKPKFFYFVPTGHNPIGNSINEKQKQEVLEITEEYNTLILEDGAYADLEYEQPVKYLRSYSKNVIFLGSFSKILSPGIRVGWIQAPEEIIKQLVLIKGAADLQTSSLGQLVLSVYLEENMLEKHIEKCRKYYRSHRDIMLEAISRYFPKEVKYTKPSSAFSVWAELPGQVSSDDLLVQAIKNGVAFEPGQIYFPKEKFLNFMRLSFSNLPAADITEGIRRLGETLTLNPSLSERGT
jgi:2-aminoadipate transaminase